jgi:multidrug efflux pump subunit AcrA (membrane-fusion protein)
MSAKVIFLSRPIEPEERRPYVAVHRSAVLASQRERSLFLVREGKAVEVPVRIGREFGDMLEVLDGAKVGDMVVLDPPEQLKHGSRIKIAEK